ncbi:MULTISPECIES: Dps family protein [Vagococcus]|uniref:Non-specific DNA-binding protein Dps / Iron-binding ferritin-like antioxidant protein / Ferroxidase n=1 Tax=Vagococcus fluvialis bH819 TaxID=1255619 RepID=A0A1X6WLL9_9ENTE|nr:MULTISPECIES: Dps family protein [Vagococcus]SLM85167.1 Non-specific DNA-binding protein Dps / Iron-binding ferritin-like antioxidant protein / Ferroxidase [Vagococcus fluvialis bH819]HCM88419.1 DNA starvation/stationary phase protection protein [Vagococcus sp.]
MSNVKTKEVLNQTVADLSQFSAVIHQTHWYMRGTSFLTLHPKMDEFMDEVNGYLDVVAERLITIGGSPYSTLKEFSDHTKIKDETGSYDKDMSERLSIILDGFHYLRNLCSEGIRITEEEQDHVSQDIFIDIKGNVEKTIWMLHAELGTAPEL